jgi:hypothetical protein
MALKKTKENTPAPAPYPGRWYGPSCYFGLHHDLHVLENETDIGKRLDEKELVRLFRELKPDLLQTDTKGHEGVNSWLSRTPTATVCKHLKKDMLKAWRKVADELGVPLHCHHSGMVDEEAGRRHPEWAVLTLRNGNIEREAWSTCVRSGYTDEKLLPQMKEMADRYRVDGIWLDGEIWGVRVCYCDACKAEFKRRTAIAEPPTDTKDANWPAWIGFHRESFEEHVGYYVAEMRKHAPQVKMCSNWLYSFRHPGEPKVETDWLSGDNHPVFGMDNTRVEARFLSTRGRVWEMALWNFYLSMNGPSLMGTNSAPGGPWVAKPPQMLMQEASITLALGGNIMIYEQPKSVRDGRMVPWHIKRLAQVSQYVKARRSVCQATETLPCVAVLHSEAHLYSQPVMTCFGDYDVDGVKGAAYSLLDNSLPLDILDEWALLPRLSEFPLVVVPEQDNLSEKAVDALKQYVQDGGRLLVTGAQAYERFGGAFLGVRGSDVRTVGGNNTRDCFDQLVPHVPAADGMVPVCNTEWRLVEPTTAKSLCLIGKTLMRDADQTRWSAATLRRVGRGAVAYIPCGIFHVYHLDRYPLLRAFIGEVAGALKPALPLHVSAPTCVEVIARRKGAKRLIHLVNRASGLCSTMRNGDVDEIPQVGPVRVEIELPDRPRHVKLAFEKGECRWKFKPAAGKRGGPGRLVAEIPLVRLHAALVIE